jgi:hypothetical protein
MALSAVSMSAPMSEAIVAAARGLAAAADVLLHACKCARLRSTGAGSSACAAPASATATTHRTLIAKVSQLFRELL